MSSVKNDDNHAQSNGHGISDISASSPDSPLNHTDQNHLQTNGQVPVLGPVISSPLAIPSEGGPEASTSRGAPPSPLPDFNPPAGRDAPLADSPSTIESARPYPQPAAATANGPRTGPDALAAVALPPTPLEAPSRALLSNYMAQHPDHTVKDAINKHFPLSNPIIRLFKRFRVKHSVIEGMTPEEVEHWEAQRSVLMRKAGWKMQGEAGPGTEVTELFWKVSLMIARGAGDG